MSRFREKDRRLQITGERHVIIPLQIINTKIGKVKPFKLSRFNTLYNY